MVVLIYHSMVDEAFVRSRRPEACFGWLSSEADHQADLL
jgi:hypothetical protein